MRDKCVRSMRYSGWGALLGGAGPGAVQCRGAAPCVCTLHHRLLPSTSEGREDFRDKHMSHTDTFSPAVGEKGEAAGLRSR